MEKHAGSAKRSVVIKAGVETVWKKLSKITKLGWLEEQKSTKFLSQQRLTMDGVASVCPTRSTNRQRMSIAHCQAWRPTPWAPMSSATRDSTSSEPVKTLCGGYKLTTSICCSSTDKHLSYRSRRHSGL